VKWIEVGKLISPQRGRRLVKSQLEKTGAYAVYQNSLKPLGYYHESNVPAGAAFVIVAGAAGDIGFSDVAFWAADDVYYFPEVDGINRKYLYHFLLTQRYKILSQVRRASIPRLSIATIEKLSIPIPCPEAPEKSLEIQAEIVRILDAYAELTVELTAQLTVELAVRKKQYNYYRDQLLNFEGRNAEWKALGDIGEFIRGKRFTKADYVEEGISVIHYGEIYTRYGVWADHAFSKVRDDMAGSLRYAEPGDVVLAGVGETVEDVCKAVAWLGTQSVAIHDDSYAFRHTMNPKYISYAMQTASFNSQKTKHVSSGKVKRILIESMKNEVKIPVPYPKDHKKSLAEQARIVAILDKFYSLTNSISDSLPREIELHQKRHEYYRDLLLSFRKPKQAVI
jgi:type I restriction enzyme S subunit